MSSHYFVKEGQEPALLILDPVPFALAVDLLAWAPLVVVSDRSVETVISWGIKVDVVLISDDSGIDLERLLSEQFPVEVIRARDRATGLRKVFEHLTHVRNSAVTILAADAKEFILGSELPDDLDIAVHDRGIRWSRIRHDFQKWLPADSGFQIFSPGDEVSVVSGAELREGSFITRGDGIVRINPAGPLWLGELH